MDSTQFGKGAIIDTRDGRDFLYTDIAGAVLPFDWYTGFDIEKQLGITLPVKNQGSSLSCGGQAWSSYGNVLTFVYDKKFNDRSAKFIYEQTAQTNGGSSGRDNSDIVIKQGWGRETLVPSLEDGKPPTEAYMRSHGLITEAVRLDAALDKAFSYAIVNPNLDEVATSIRDNYGCIIGITGSNNGTWLSIYPNSPKSGDSLWRHWVYAGRAKLINGKKYIGILNSWGEIGEKGWQWISEDYFKALNGLAIFSAWTLLYKVIVRHTFSISMKYMEANDEVKSLQKCLQSIGYFPKDQECTGFYGSITRSSIFAFQKDHVAGAVFSWSWMQVWYGLGNNVGPLTITALNKLFS